MEMIITGFLIGLSMVVFLGPVFFTLLQTTLSQSTFAGVMVAIGIFISDIVIVVIVNYSSSFLPIGFFSNIYFVLVSFAILFGFGVKYIFFSNTVKNNSIQTNESSYLKNFVAGFGVNFMNPFVFAVWLGVLGYAKSISSESLDLVYFFGFALIAILFTDLLKVKLASLIKKFISENKMHILYRLMGGVMILFSFRVLFSVL